VRPVVRWPTWLVGSIGVQIDVVLVVTRGVVYGNPRVLAKGIRPDRCCCCYWYPSATVDLPLAYLVYPIYQASHWETVHYCQTNRVVHSI
jgi:hypothetical protein